MFLWASSKIIGLAGSLLYGDGGARIKLEQFLEVVVHPTDFRSREGVAD